MLKVGEYIRTEHGNIFKVSKTTDFGMNNVFPHDENGIMIVTQIIKHSPNIMDIIEKDDYVNGCRVYEVNESGIMVYQNAGDIDIDVDYSWISKRRIKSIVTKEQFEAMKYEVE